MTSSAPGRPRRYEAATELQMIFDAALKVMRRNDFQDVTVADILAEAGISTRSFYRHFSSKDELLCALYRRDAERAAAVLDARVRAASTPREALEAWIDEILGIGHDKAKARRAALFGSAGALRVEGSAEEARRAVHLLMQPLVGILEAGRADGSFHTVDPQADARIVSAITWFAAGLGSPAGDRRPRAVVRDEVVSFVLRALRAADHT